MKMCCDQLIGSPIRVVGISDRAYELEEDETRARVGHIMVVMVAGRSAASVVSSKQPIASIAGPELCTYAPASHYGCRSVIDVCNTNAFSTEGDRTSKASKESPFGRCVLIDCCC